jgi:hypothetical protein
LVWLRFDGSSRDALFKKTNTRQRLGQRVLTMRSRRSLPTA